MIQVLSTPLPALTHHAHDAYAFEDRTNFVYTTPYEEQPIFCRRSPN